MSRRNTTVFQIEPYNRRLVWLTVTATIVAGLCFVGFVGRGWGW
jgi:hypothetical protein